jgi:hypothetical protein
MIFLTTSCTTVQWSESKEDVDLLETVYRFLIDEYEPADPIFLSIGFDRQRRVYKDPPVAVFAHLTDLGLRLRPASDVGQTDVGVVEKESGKQVILFYVVIIRRSVDGVLLECGHRKNMEHASGAKYMAVRSEGRWTLIPAGGVWLSQGQPYKNSKNINVQVAKSSLFSYN